MPRLLPFPSNLLAHDRQADLRNALKYLSSKHRVQSTLILRRDTGSILHAGGQITATAVLDAIAPFPQHTPDASSDGPNKTSSPSTADGDGGATTGTAAAATTKVQELAAVAWRFASTAGALAMTLEGDEKVGLLRVRTGKSEVIIVPDDKFLLVVISDPWA
ncbi:MAG: hypothetical protein M1832_002958 [Thelocarpon impressellum]|nr:MAG: hypothetical protein M1832_002958 [Thelocarpon impressellum]